MPKMAQAEGMLDACLNVQIPPDSFREILRSVSDFLMVIARDWTILYANDSEFTREITTALGLANVQDLVGRNYWQVVPMYRGSVIEENITAVMERGEKRTWEAQSLITGRWNKSFAYPSKEGVTLFSLDITERKLTEAALRRSEEHKSFLLRLSDVLAQLTDVSQIETTVTHMLKEQLQVTRVSFSKCNAATKKVHIYTEDQDTPAPSLLGQYAYKDFPSYICALNKGTPIVITDMETTTELSAEERSRFLFMGVHAQITIPLIKCGKVVACHSVRQNTPRKWREDEVDLVRESGERAWSAIDHVCAQQALRQSEAKAQALAQELEKRNQFITDFFINMSHEFKTPLSILLLCIDMLERKVARLRSAGDIRKHAAMMRQNAYRLNRLVGNLLDITKLDAGFMEPVWECCDIVDWLKNLVKSTELYAEQRGLTLHFTSNVKKKLIVTDGFLVDRILLNLLSNAIKHTPAGGCVEVFCQVSPAGVRIEVADNGEGIAPEKLGEIFERFRQAHSTMTRISEGSGVGLALTKAIAELLEGTISVQSTPGMGSRFTVDLPMLYREVDENAPRPLGMQLQKRVDMEMSDIL